MLTKKILTASCALLLGTLAACDVNSTVSKNAAEPSTNEPQDSVSDSLPPTTKTSFGWGWPQKDLNGWAFGIETPVVFWPDTGGFGIKAPSDSAYPDIFIRSPALNLAGKEYITILVDIECVVPGERNDLAIYYMTANHGETADFRLYPSDPLPLAAGSRRTLVYDTARPSAGGRDWLDSTIERMRFDLPQGADSEYIIHSLRICHSADSECSR